MSEIAAELERVGQVCDRPTVRLLDRKFGPFVLAVFRCSFSSRRTRIGADDLHTRVDAYLGDLRSMGVDAPTGTGRSLCVRWLGEKWLFRTTSEAGIEEYSLTGDALESLSLVESLTRQRSLISESRLSTILSVVRRAATRASSDTEDRIARIDAEIAQLVAERERVASGGAVEDVSEREMLDEYVNLVDLVAQLPGDFARVTEAMTKIRQDILAELRTDTRPLGEVIDTYLEASDNLLTSTSEGQAFEGALDILSSDSFLADLRADLRLLLGHEVALVLEQNEREDLAGTVATIRDGYTNVLAQRARLTSTLRDHIVHHDPIADREIERVLRDLDTELANFFSRARPRTPLRASLAAGVLDIDYVHERMWDPGVDAGPPPLVVDSEAAEPLSIKDLRRQGGPSLDELRRRLPDVAGAGDRASAGDAFNRLDAELRRPVEILGLLHLAARAGVSDLDDNETYRTVGIYGQPGEFSVPRLRMNAADAAAIADDRPCRDSDPEDRHHQENS